ncbi:hypothetical protein JCM3775_000764 [Rhodotorula graminis]|uniref:Uncharacterized protein n=1 Tax=Rhodotorula graminis (strain WP1) TaxID=578459 RepID=A0A194SBA0_RHOGW|nr:uncharacterized protein RHOBADRAFT_41858 [Rhodotorula graminis WP1]KPV77859.1 hypothetical protein RHOBADRAFT_41858 [Rhodotorula graminis WP1]
MPRTYDQTDPRRPANALPYRFPASSSTLPELLSFASMLCSGLAMLTRYAIWPWFGLILALSGILGQKNLGAQKQASDQSSLLGGYTSLMFASTSLMSIYSPILLGQAVKAGNIGFSINKGLIYLPRDLPTS